jgi:hypothetical protein
MCTECAIQATELLYDYRLEGDARMTWRSARMREVNTLWREVEKRVGKEAALRRWLRLRYTDQEHRRRRGDDASRGGSPHLPEMLVQ